MRRVIRGECLKFAETVQDAFPMMAQMDVPRCLADMKVLHRDKQREWAHRSRGPLRLAAGLYHLPQAAGLIAESYGPEGKVHTVLCLTAHLLARLPEAAERIWVPDGEPDLRTWSPLLGMHFVHAALSWAEAAQDREMGWETYPGGGNPRRPSPATDDAP